MGGPAALSAAHWAATDVGAARLRGWRRVPNSGQNGK